MSKNVRIPPPNETDLAVRGGLQAGVMVFVLAVTAVVGVWIWKETVGGPATASAQPPIVATSQNPSSDADALKSNEQSIKDADSESPDGFIDIDASQEWLNKAKRKMARGQHAVAIPMLNKAIEYDPENARAYYNLGLSYVMVGDERQARRQQRLLHDMDRNLANLLDTLLR